MHFVQNFINILRHATADLRRKVAPKVGKNVNDKVNV